MASSSSPSSFVPNPSHKKYDVFLSFRGEDTRNGFTSHLHKALKKKYIETYIDERLESGDVISETLLNAIEESKLSLIIFSENYASSSWCLEELVHILECQEKNGQIVIPVFYHVDPSNVRKQEASYAEAFATLEKRYTDDTNKLKRWRTALTTAANLSGWDGPITRNESELVETIINDIEKKLKSIPRNDDYCKGLVGIDKRVEHVESLLQIHSSLETVRIIGIWGMGGLGKTTLAHVVFKQLCSQFEGTCFLENVREEWQKHGSVYLKGKLFSQFGEEKDPHMLNITVLQEMLSHKRLLIVLDDVDDVEYFEYLLEDRSWIKTGSRIIITTRNKQVLRNIEADEIYDYEHLNEKEALQLFCLNAFKESSLRDSSSWKLSKKVLNYAKGVPLALKVLGSHLYSRSEEEWDSALEVIDLDRKIQKIMEISFNALTEKEKTVFLDIACFFKGMKRDEVEDILNNIRGYFPYGITTLIDKSLITIGHENRVWMHDLIQEMGWVIASGQSIGGSLSPSRLWITSDIFDALKSNTGIETIEGIFLIEHAIGKDIKLKPEIFKRMHHLRFLKLPDHLPLAQGRPLFLPEKLVYLEWDWSPISSLHFTSYNYLVKLHMRSGQLKKLWNGLQDLQNLKYVDLEYSEKLTNIPDLSRANLKILNLKGCTRLVRVPPLKFQQVAPKQKSLACSLQFFSYQNTDFFSSFDRYYSFVCNYLVNLSGCSKLKTLSNMSGYIEHIMLGSTAVEELHSSICSLQSLISVDLNNCKRLKCLPSNIFELKSLEYLNLGGCLSFKSLPAELPMILKGLNLCQTAIAQVHSSSFECLPSLKFLNMNNCTRLKTLPASICKLKSLQILCLAYCSKLKSLPEISEPMESLEVPFLEGTRIKERITLSLGTKRELLWCVLFDKLPKSRICKSFIHEIEIDLTCRSILKIPDWYHPLSPLELDVVDQSTGTFRDIATVVFEYSRSGNHMFRICKCKHIGRRNGSFYLIKGTDHKSPNKFMATTRHREVFYPSFMQIPSCECSNFDQVRQSMMNELQIKILSIATESTEELIPEVSRNKSRSYMFCCEGNEIPEWFTYQSRGSSIDIKFSQHCQYSNLFGFALCIVFEHDEHRKYEDYYDCRMRFRCVHHYKTPYFTGRKLHWTWENQVLMNICAKLDESDHIFIQYFRDDELYDGATEASFKFYLEAIDCHNTSDILGKYKVKKCGVYVLYGKDADELIRR